MACAARHPRADLLALVAKLLGRELCQAIREILASDGVDAEWSQRARSKLGPKVTFDNLYLGLRERAALSEAAVRDALAECLAEVLTSECDARAALADK